jgi:hypothetical protein
MTEADIRDYNEPSLAGSHNSDLKSSAERIKKGNGYRDLSTVWVTPTREHHLDAQVVFQSWDSVVKPQNQQFLKICIGNAEVADAYNAAVELILCRDKYPTPWKYMLTVETDNLPPKDGLMRLYESVDKYDIIGGLYWMKGEGGNPHIYGNPDEPGTFRPQVPLENAVQPCNMVAMGFTLFNLDVFRKVKAPWFKTSTADDNQEFTQDGYFFKKAHDEGVKLRVACDTRVKVGHIDFKTRKIW